MNKEAYRLANKIGTRYEADGDCLKERLSEFEMKKYQRAVSEEIQREKRMQKGRIRKALGAACAALVLIACTAVFGEEVNAAVRQIGWSIKSAFGLSGELENYREVVNTSVSDQGYVITLQEAAVSNEKLVIAYTLQREDGQPMGEILTPDGFLYVNGRLITGAANGSAGFVDESHTVLGAAASYEISGIDLSQNNEYRLDFEQIGFQEGIQGSWSFEFCASGADLIADTTCIAIGEAFQLPDGVTVTLDEYTSNALEQEISYHKSGTKRTASPGYMLMIRAVDSTGRQVEFGVGSEDEKSGYMRNEDMIDGGRISDEATAATLTLYMVELPEEDGQISDDYIQIGEPFELEL